MQIELKRFGQNRGRIFTGKKQNAEKEKNYHRNLKQEKKRRGWEHTWLNAPGSRAQNQNQQLFGGWVGPPIPWWSHHLGLGLPGETTTKKFGPSRVLCL